MKRWTFYSLLTVLIGAVLMPSCQIEKRVHRPGYHVQWKKKPSSMRSSRLQSGTSKTDLTLASTRMPEAPQAPIAEFREPLEHTGLKGVLSEKTIDQIDEECQLLVMTDGRRLDVKVLEISQDEIKYRKCGMPDGPLVIVDKIDVDRIIYENGAVDVISGYSATDERVGQSGSKTGGTTHQAAGEKRLEVLGMLSMILAIVGIFFAGIILGATAIILAIISLSKFSSRPLEFGGRGMAIAGLIIGLVAVAGALIVLSMLA